VQPKAPDTLVVPALHGVHVAKPPLENEFAPQGLHAVAPVPDEYVPPGQGQQFFCPPALWNWPAGQATHEAAPAVE